MHDMRLYCIFLLQQFQIQLIDSNGISDFGFYSQIAMKQSNFAMFKFTGFLEYFLIFASFKYVKGNFATKKIYILLDFYRFNRFPGFLSEY